jgi:hypothetical protein
MYNDPINFGAEKKQTVNKWAKKINKKKRQQNGFDEKKPRQNFFLNQEAFGVILI